MGLLRGVELASHGSAAACVPVCLPTSTVTFHLIHQSCAAAAAAVGPESLLVYVQGHMKLPLGLLNGCVGLAITCWRSAPPNHLQVGGWFAVIAVRVCCHCSTCSLSLQYVFAVIAVPCLCPWLLLSPLAVHHNKCSRSLASSVT
jgi:hypothetical protein